MFKQWYEQETSHAGNKNENLPTISNDSVSNVQSSNCSLTAFGYSTDEGNEYNNHLMEDQHNHGDEKLPEIPADNGSGSAVPLKDAHCYNIKHAANHHCQFETVESPPSSEKMPAMLHKTMQFERSDSVLYPPQQAAASNANQSH